MLFVAKENKKMITDAKLDCPYLPTACPRVRTDKMPLSLARDYMTSLAPDTDTREAILSVVEKWLDNPNTGEPLSSIRTILDSIRLLPRGDKRLKSMNTLVRTLGQPDVFAIFLDMVRAASQRLGTREQALSEISRKSSKHAVYGWCGQTRLALSSIEPNHNTLKPEIGVQNFLGKTPTSAWALSMHIWQPNALAKGFSCGRQTVPNVIAEPPHSHPFDFASMVVIGEMHQSIYTQLDPQQQSPIQKEATIQKGRYDGIILEHVHGVWPPHEHRETGELMTLEDRILMKSGDSYYMSCDTIHDVQIDANVASKKPAITLFLRSESFVKPHVYMASSMADFHEIHPNLKDQGYPLSENDWDEKLKLVADYVRGKNSTLNLDHVVKYDNEYAFFHR